MPKLTPSLSFVAETLVAVDLQEVQQSCQSSQFLEPLDAVEQLLAAAVLFLVHQECLPDQE
jgi:hypothetical protein